MNYKIYIASLSDYNAGILHGAWIELEDANIDTIQSQISKILKSSPIVKKFPSMSPAEEWAIHDYELRGISISEYEDLNTILELVAALKEHGEAFAIYYSFESYKDVPSCKSAFEEAYCGEYRSLIDYAEELFDECYLHQIPESLRNYIDYESFANDLKCDGYYEQSSYVFRPV